MEFQDSSATSRVTALGNTCVLGLGSTGQAVARYLAKRLGTRISSVTVFGGKTSQANDETRALQEMGCTVVLGTEAVEGSYDLTVASPGISEFSPFFLAAKACSKEVISEPEFAWRESPSRWLAITGTNGKTTTTTLVRDLLRAGGFVAEAVGNIGKLAITEVEERQAGEWLVAELSSYQLATTQAFHPVAACLLNITPDHLAWHKTMDNYAAAKARIFQNMNAGDLAVISNSDEYCRSISNSLNERGVRVCTLDVTGDPGGSCAAYLDGEMLVVRLDGDTHKLVSANQLAIAGVHNYQNALAAAALALEAGVTPQDVRSGLCAFQPLEHRIEPCGELDGVRYVNDSKATNVDATSKALTAFAPGTIVLLAGGHDKGTELASLARDVVATCRVAVCYGEAGSRIAQAFREENACEHGNLEVYEAAHMQDAYELARSLANAGETVLLSPACSSFDEFSCFEERGERFKALVAQDLADKESK